MLTIFIYVDQAADIKNDVVQSTFTKSKTNKIAINEEDDGELGSNSSTTSTPVYSIKIQQNEEEETNV